MTEAEIQTLMAYMRAAIRAHRPIELDALNLDELRGVFHAIPLSRVTLPEWMNRMGAKTEPAAEPEREITEEEMAEHNDAAIFGLMQMQAENPEVVKVKVESKKDE